MTPTNSTEIPPLSLALARCVDEVCCHFEADWKTAVADTPPRLEDYVGELPEPGRTVLVLELLRVEVYHRRRLG